MKRTVCLILLLASFAAFAIAQPQVLQEGTIVRMRMAECFAPEHRWMAAMSGEVRASSGELCPEYVLVTDKVVYRIVGRSSDQLIPLAEYTKFRLHNNELLIRVDDANRESHFHIKEMILRAEWERAQHRAEDEKAQAPGGYLDSALVSANR